MNISLAITTFNRFEYTVESFAQVIDDPRIDDIVILDDCSTDGSYKKLRDHFNWSEKVRVIRQVQNRGMSLNKRDAIALSKNEWVIIFDSDNVITQEYLDAFFNIELYKANQIYCPSFAKPEFDYTVLANKVITNQTIYNLLHGSHKEKVNLLLNTCNMVVSRTEYLKAYEHNSEMKGTDTVWFNYLWLKNGNSFYVVPGMEYFHRVHHGSGFLQDADYNMKKAAEVRRLIMQL